MPAPPPPARVTAVPVIELDNPTPPLAPTEPAAPLEPTAPAPPPPPA